MLNWIWGEACWLGRCWFQPQGCRISECDSTFNVWLLTAYKSYHPSFLSSLHLGKTSGKSKGSVLRCRLRTFSPASPPNHNKSPTQPPFPAHLNLFFLTNLGICSTLPRSLIMWVINILHSFGTWLVSSVSISKPNLGEGSPSCFFKLMTTLINEKVQVIFGGEVRDRREFNLGILSLRYLHIMYLAGFWTHSKLLRNASLLFSVSLCVHTPFELRIYLSLDFYQITEAWNNHK